MQTTHQPAQDTPGPGPLQVLVVEDNPINLDVARKMLVRIGCAVDAVADGQEAIAAVRSKAYDLVFMDCHLPELDGFAATEAIRALAVTRQPSIIAMTADVRPETAARCFACGMNDYLSKPYGLAELRSKVELWGGCRPQADSDSA